MRYLYTLPNGQIVDMIINEIVKTKPLLKKIRENN